LRASTGRTSNRRGEAKRERRALKLQLPKEHHFLRYFRSSRQGNLCKARREEVTELDLETDRSNVLDDCVRKIEQSGQPETGVFAHDIEEIHEGVETPIQQALRSLE